MTQLRVLMMLAALALAAGCGGGGEGLFQTQPGEVEAPDAPKILETNPARDERVNAFDRTILVSYDRALDPASIRVNAVRVVSPIGEVLGQLTHDAEKFVLRYELASEMFRDTPYEIVVAAGLEAFGGGGPTIEQRIPFETLPAVNQPASIIEDSGNSLPLALEITESGFGLFLRKEDGPANSEELKAFVFDPDSGFELLQTADAGDDLHVDIERGVRVAAGRNAVMTWQVTKQAGTQIFARRFNPDLFTWTDAEPLQVFNQGPPSVPQAAVSPNGDAIAVWTQEEGTFNKPFARMRLFDVRNGRWGGDFPVGAGNVPNPSVGVGMGNSGDTTIVYVEDEENDNELPEILARRRTPETGFQVVEVVRVADAEEFEIDAVVYASNGIVHAVWREIVSAVRSTTLYHARFVPASLGGPAWSEAQPVETVLGNIGSVRAAAADDGSLAIAWVVKPDAETSHVRMAHVAAGGKVGLPQDGQANEAQVEGNIRMDAQRDGTVALAWLGKRDGAVADQYRTALYSPSSGQWTRGAVGPQRTIGSPRIDVALRPDGTAEVRWVEPNNNDRASGNDVIQAIRLVHGAPAVNFRPVPLAASGKSDVLIDLDALGRGILAWLHHVPENAFERHSARTNLR